MFNDSSIRGFGAQTSEAQYLQEVINMLLKAGLAQVGGKLKPEMMKVVQQMVHATFGEVKKANLSPTLEHTAFINAIKMLAAKAGIRV